MDMKVRKPSGFLRDFVESYWSLEIDPGGTPEVTERVLPSGMIQMIFHYGRPFFQRIGGNDVYQERLIICGQKKSFCDVSAPSGAGMIGVVFKPYGFRPFFHVPAGEITEYEIPLPDIIGGDGKELQARLLSSLGFEARIKLIEDFLLKRYYLLCRYSWGIARECVNTIQQSRGFISVQDLSRRFNISVRNLERVFSGMIGISPKFFIRINRFRKAVIMAQTQLDSSLTTIAHDCGYYDQSHFINESKALSGMNPSDFLNHGCSQSENPEP